MAAVVGANELRLAARALQQLSHVEFLPSKLLEGADDEVIDAEVFSGVVT